MPILRITSGVSWTVPADWNSSSNQIYLIGGGGGSSGTGRGTGAYRAGGAGGGGGAITKLSNVTLTPSTAYSIAIGAGGTAGTRIDTANTTATAGTGGATTLSLDPYSPPTLVGTTKTQLTSASTTITIDVPAGTVDGNLLIAILTTANTDSWTTPSGWTVGITPSAGRTVFYKTAASEPASYTFTASVSRTLQGYIVSYSNAQFSVGGALGTLSSPTVAPAITTTVADSIVFDVASTNVGNITFSTPTGYTLLNSDSDGKKRYQNP